MALKWGSSRLVAQRATRPSISCNVCIGWFWGIVVPRQTSYTFMNRIYMCTHTQMHAHVLPKNPIQSEWLLGLRLSKIPSCLAFKTDNDACKGRSFPVGLCSEGAAIQMYSQQRFGETCKNKCVVRCLSHRWLDLFVICLSYCERIGKWYKSMQENARDALTSSRMVLLVRTCFKFQIA